MRLWKRLDDIFTYPLLQCSGGVCRYAPGNNTGTIYSGNRH